MILHPYFKLIGIEPGRVVTAGFGTIDFSKPVKYETLLSLYQTGFRYIALTTEGKRNLLPAKIVKSKKK